METATPASSHTRRVRGSHPVTVGFPSPEVDVRTRGVPGRRPVDGKRHYSVAIVAATRVEEIRQRGVALGVHVAFTGGPRLESRGLLNSGHAEGRQRRRMSPAHRSNELTSRVAVSIPRSLRPLAFYKQQILTLCQILTARALSSVRQGRRPSRPSNHRHPRPRSRRECGARLLDWMLT